MSINLTLFGLFLFLIVKSDGISISKMKTKKEFFIVSFYIDSLKISINSSKSPYSCSTYSEIPLVDPITASIKTLAEDLSACRYSSSDLVRWYLSRIDAVNQQGSHLLHAVIETNPDALDIADALDQERRINGSRSYLHGIPTNRHCLYYDICGLISFVKD